MNKKKYFYKIMLILILINLYFIFNYFCFGATPQIVTKLSNAFEDIENWLLKLSAPAAAVAVAVGLFMKKFSFGDEERIRSAKKIIRGSLFSYGLLLTIDLILSTIKSLLN